MIKIRLLILTVVMTSLGGLAGWYVYQKLPQLNLNRESVIYKVTGIHKPQILGFAPYWLINNNSYDYLTNIAYFAVVVGDDGSIVVSGEPGLAKLKSEDWKKYRNSSANAGYEITVQSGDDGSITKLIANPVAAANRLMDQLEPMMKTYNFQNINLDIEDLRAASDRERQNFAKFVETVRQRNPGGKLTAEIPVAAFTKKTIIAPHQIQPYIDYAVLMAYDFHYRSSMTAGPVAPIGGAGVDREIDVNSAVTAALAAFKPEQLILGIPLYGYEWESINNSAEAPIIPGSGQTASRQRIAELLANCTNCEIKTDDSAGENQLTFEDNAYNSIHQIYYDSDTSISQKIELAKKYHLGGIAFWALGYEDGTLAKALGNYKNFYWQD